MRSLSEFVASVGRQMGETRIGRRIAARTHQQQGGSVLLVPTKDTDAASNKAASIDLRTVSDVMSAPPETIGSKTSVREAARMMRTERIGDVLVLNDSEDLVGIVTDRDIAIRLVAEDLDPTKTTVEQIMSSIEASVPPTARVTEALDLMRHHEFRRLPVIANGKAVGVVTLGDLSRSKAAGAALAEISEAPPNN